MEHGKKIYFITSAVFLQPFLFRICLSRSLKFAQHKQSKCLLLVVLNLPDAEWLLGKVSTIIHQEQKLYLGETDATDRALFFLWEIGEMLFFNKCFWFSHTHHHTSCNDHLCYNYNKCITVILKKLWQNATSTFWPCIECRWFPVFTHRYSVQPFSVKWRVFKLTKAFLKEYSVCYISFYTVCKCNKRAGKALLDENKSIGPGMICLGEPNKQSRKFRHAPG